MKNAVPVSELPEEAMKSNNVKMQAWNCPRAFQKVQERRSESEPERVTKSKFTECLSSSICRSAAASCRH